MMTVCGTEVRDSAQNPMYFDLQDLLAQSASALAAADVLCQKQMQFKGIRKSTQLRKDSAGWMREWRHLLYFDLNQIAERGLYTISTYKKDTLIVQKYLPKIQTKNTDVKELLLTSDPKGRPLALKGKYLAEKHLYHQYAELDIRFEPYLSSSRIRSCFFKGYQKALGQDTIPYQVSWIYQPNP